MCMILSSGMSSFVTGLSWVAFDVYSPSGFSRESGEEISASVGAAVVTLFKARVVGRIALPDLSDVGGWHRGSSSFKSIRSGREPLLMDRRSSSG